jgi:ribonuclease-3
MDVDGLEERLGHRFEERDHLETALTHRSFAAEEPGVTHNERMEFLGDAVLGLAVTRHLFTRYPDLPEGQLAKARASTVSRPRLAEVAAALEVGPLLRLGKGEIATGGRDKDSILADAMEAILGAVYLDAGYEAARDVTLAHFGGIADEMAGDPGSRDYKTRLQERLASDGAVPQYLIESSGPDHARAFVATVLVGGTVLGSGTGTSKKEAQQAAAAGALEHLG